MLKNILKKVLNKHFFSLAGNVAMSVLSIIMYAILYRLLTEVEMGKWVFFQFALVLFDTIRTGFLQTAFIKFFAGADKHRADEVTGSVWFLALSITLIVVVIDIACMGGINFIHNESLNMFIRWGGIAFVLILPMNVSTWILQAEQRFDVILYIRMISQGSFIVFIVLLYFHSGHTLNLQSTFYCYLLSSLLTAIICFMVGWTAVGTYFRRSRACIMEIVHFGKYSVGTVVSSSLLKTSDSFIINFMLGPAALAIYNLPLRLMEIIEIPIRSFLANAMPEMSIAANKNNNVSVATIMKKYAGILTMLLIPISIFGLITSNIIVSLIGGGKYVNSEAANVFRILLLFAALSPIDRFMGITLDIIHKPQLNLIKVLITLFVNATTDVIGILIFHNIYGPAWASIFTFFVAIIYGYVALRKYLYFTLPGIIKYGYTESINLVQGFFKSKLVKA